MQIEGKKYKNIDNILEFLNKINVLCGLFKKRQ